MVLAVSCSRSAAHAHLNRTTDDTFAPGHMNTLSEEQIVDTLRLVVNAETFTVLAPMFGRIAVSLLILSIIGPAQTTYRIVLWTIVAIQVLENAAIIIELYTQCKDERLTAGPLCKAISKRRGSSS